MITNLDDTERRRLLAFVCSFAWADAEIQDDERNYISRLVKALGLDHDDQEQVDAWLQYPPDPEEVDPQEVPTEHRQLILAAARDMIESDGVIYESEAETLALLEQLLGQNAPA